MFLLLLCLHLRHRHCGWQALRQRLCRGRLRGHGTREPNRCRGLRGERKHGGVRDYGTRLKSCYAHLEERVAPLAAGALRAVPRPQRARLAAVACGARCVAAAAPHEQTCRTPQTCSDRRRTGDTGAPPAADLDLRPENL